MRAGARRRSERLREAVATESMLQHQRECAFSRGISTPSGASATTACARCRRRGSEDSPDILLLQEVGLSAAPAVLKCLRDLGLPGVHSGDIDAREKAYGCLVASRWPVERSRSLGRLPWPQLVARASVASPHGVLDALSVHIPNGSKNGWNKVRSFEVLADELRNAGNVPRIVAGDFNEPREVRPSGQLVTFGETVAKSGRVSCGGDKKGACGETHPRRRWDAAVRSVLAGQSSHGLRHAFHSVHGPGVSTTSHLTRGRPRFLDHLFISRHFEVLSCSYNHEWREAGLSDHSAVLCELAPSSSKHRNLKDAQR